jgi:nucleotide-binding universal stress UspA family protein
MVEGLVEVSRRLASRTSDRYASMVRVAGPIVVGFDGHELAERALDRAIADAKAAGVKLVIVVVEEAAFDPTMPPLFNYSPQPQAIPLDDQEPDRPLLKQLGDEALDRARAAGVAAELVADVGDPMRTIVDAARDHGASSVVLGSHHYNALQRFLGEDVARAVERRVDCEVVTVE